MCQRSLVGGMCIHKSSLCVVRRFGDWESVGMEEWGMLGGKKTKKEKREKWEASHAEGKAELHYGSFSSCP